MSSSLSSTQSSHSDDDEWEYSSSMTIPLDDVLPQKFQEEVSEEAFAAIEMAIRTTKNSLLESEENSDARKILVKRLIKLRIRHEDVKERLMSKSNASIETKGHTFVDTKDPNINYSHISPYWSDGKNKIYCQVCGTTIRIYMQYSQHCHDCGFCVHHACVPYIKRDCVGVKVRTKPDFIMTICPEKSLPSLNYQCSECQIEFVSSSSKLKPNLCDYTGLYYCSLCHWGSKGITPARILQNWDFTKVPLSQVSKQYLSLMVKKPVINIEKVNPRLFAAVHELNEVRDLRRKLFFMKKYLEVCRFASDEKLLLELSDRQHFVDSVDYYSLEDLLDTESGELLRYMEKITGSFYDHIVNCVLCYARGFICELCKNKKDILFPFSQDGYLCEYCKGVCHHYCFRGNGSICPKCKRLQERKTK
ncbi:differentially expressed in FDCP 8 homolog B [Lepeophtheirus salmonis]|uniref:Phorbol-ester/DAG-type domain-containing protein n=1 Tax=Lepeophtheirus salmonis TaxID=72036 RepID=A0A0K2VD44_LEPSM|nr:differentially expressed in FDCP 8 homolog B-like [Lepeophtheirus salmonis]